MSISKSSIYLDNHHKTPPATSGETLDEDSFFIDAIFDIPNEGKNKNQQINTIVEGANTEWSVTLNTNGIKICHKIDSGAQVNAIPENQIENLQTKPRITKSTTTLSLCNESNILVKGQCTLDIQHGGKNVPFSAHHRTELKQTIKPYHENAVQFQFSKA